MRYRVPEPQVAKLLAAGRFRVKANIDEATARRLALELEGLGAVVTVVDAESGAPLNYAVPPSADPALRAEPSIHSGAPGRAEAAPARTTMPPGAPRYESGLKAAFSAAPLPSSLGALEKLAADTPAAPIRLASLDGADEIEPPVSALGAGDPPPPTVPPLAIPPLEDVDAPLSAASPAPAVGGGPSQGVASGAPAVGGGPSHGIASGAPAVGGGPSLAAASPSADPFAPPPIEDAPLDVVAPPPRRVRRPTGPPEEDMARDDVATSQAQAGSEAPRHSPFEPPPLSEERLDVVPETVPRRKAATPAAKGTLAPEPGAGDDARAPTTVATAGAESRSVLDPAPPGTRRAARVGGSPLAARFEGKPLARVLVGVVFALAVGYLPMHLYAESAEASRYEPILAELRSAQSNIQSLREYEEELPALRRDALDRLERARRRIQVTSGLLWIVFSAGAGWAWFRKLT